MIKFSFVLYPSYPSLGCCWLRSRLFEEGKIERVSQFSILIWFFFSEQLAFIASHVTFRVENLTPFPDFLEPFSNLKTSPLFTASFDIVTSKYSEWISNVYERGEYTAKTFLLAVKRPSLLLKGQSIFQTSEDWGELFVTRSHSTPPREVWVLG